MDNVLFMKQTADRLFGDNYIWSVLAAGRFQIPFVTQAAMMGGNVRVGCANKNNLVAVVSETSICKNSISSRL